MVKYENIGIKNPTGPDIYTKERAMILQENDGRAPRLIPKKPEEFTSRELFGLGIKVLVTYRGQADQYPMIVWHIVQNLNNPEWLKSLLKRYHINPVVFKKDGTDEERAGWLKCRTEEIDVINSRFGISQFKPSNWGLENILLSFLLLKLIGAKNMYDFFNIQAASHVFKNFSTYTFERIEEANKIRKEANKKTK
jgi:hypothetical protein